MPELGLIPGTSARTGPRSRRPSDRLGGLERDIRHSPVRSRHHAGRAAARERDSHWPAAGVPLVRRRVLAATLNREADAEIARILRCQEGRWEPKRPALVPRKRGNDDDLVPTKPPPSSQGLYEQLNEPGDGGLSSSSRDRRSCSSTPKTCDHAPRLPACVAGRLKPAPRARCRCCGRSIRRRPRSSPSRSVRALRASPQCTRARL